jgi:hypothetical protein
MTTGDYILGARFGSPLQTEQMQTFLATASTSPWVPPRKG